MSRWVDGQIHKCIVIGRSTVLAPKIYDSRDQGPRQRIQGRKISTEPNK